MIEEIKILLGDSASNFTDAQIGLSYRMALNEVKEYTKADEDYALRLLAARITVIKLNRLGTEGLTSQVFNGVSESYLNDIPADIQRLLNLRRKVVVK